MRKESNLRRNVTYRYVTKNLPTGARPECGQVKLSKINSRNLMNGFDTVGAVSALLFSSGSASSWLHHTLDVLPSRLWQENPTAVTMCASPLL
jgi:hypothetical protein